MPYVNLDPNYFEHPKTRRLVALLGPMSDVLPIKLWAYCAKIHPKDGIMRGYSEAELMSILGITFKLSTGLSPIRILVKVGFINKLKDGYSCVDWKQHEGHLEAFSRRAKAGAKARWKKYASSNASSNAKPMLNHAPSVPYRTVPNLTIPTVPTQASGEQKPVDPSPKILPGKNGRSEALRQVKLLDLRMPFGEYKGVPVGDLDVDYCKFVREKCSGVGQELKDALELRIQLKKDESAGMSKEAKLDA